jgi:CheY-like chemotaxis protein
VLLADDSVAARKSIQKVLEMAGVEVVSVGNGDLALKRLEEVLPQMVLLDVIMPGKNGYEVCAEIKADTFFGRLPVLLVSGDFEPYDEAEAVRVGADGHLVKPFDSQAISVIQSVWERYSAAVPAPADVAPQAEDDAGAAAEPDGSSTEGVDAYATVIVTPPDLSEYSPAPEPPPQAPATRAVGGTAPIEPVGVVTGPIAATAAKTEALDTGAMRRATQGGRASGESFMRDASTGELRLVYGACPVCRAALATGDIFCLACGAAVFVTAAEAEALEEIAAGRRCADCGGPLASGDVFCLACGALVER